MKLEPRQEQLYNAVSDIDQKYIDEALSAKTRKRGYTVPKRLAALAATLALLLTPWGKIFTPAANPSDGSNPQLGSSHPPVVQAPVSLFTITVSASENEEVELDPEVGATVTSNIPGEETEDIVESEPVYVYNEETGEIEEYSIFIQNTNFCVFIWPNEHIPQLWTTRMELSYNGKVVEGKDPYINISFAARDGITGYAFGGYVTEPTDVTTTFYNQEGVLLQEIVYKISPTISNTNSVTVNKDGTETTEIEGFKIEIIENNCY